MDAVLRRIEDRMIKTGEVEASHTTLLQVIADHLKELNGSVADLKEDSIEFKIFQKTHAHTVETIDEINERCAERGKENARKFQQIDAQRTLAVQAEKAKDTERKAWIDAVRPWLDRLLIAAIVLLLWNGPAILSLISKALHGG